MTIRVIVKEDQSTPIVNKPVHKFARKFGIHIPKYEEASHSLCYYYCREHVSLEAFLLKAYLIGPCPDCKIYLMEGRSIILSKPLDECFYIKKFNISENKEAKKILNRMLKLKAFL